MPKIILYEKQCKRYIKNSYDMPVKYHEKRDLETIAETKDEEILSSLSKKTIIHTLYGLLEVDLNELLNPNPQMTYQRKINISGKGIKGLTNARGNSMKTRKARKSYTITLDEYGYGKVDLNKKLGIRIEPATRMYELKQKYEKR